MLRHVLPVVLLAACATTRTVSRGDVASNESLAHHINRDELEPLQMPGSTLDALRRLRPEFLRPSVAVYENGVYLGGVDMLASIPVAIVVDIERMSPSKAAFTFGSLCRCAAGAIVVQTRP